MIRSVLFNKTKTIINNLNIKNINKRYFSTSETQNDKESTRDDKTQQFQLFMLDHPSINLLPTKPHILVGMSGGVDSTIAAHLLKKKGFKITGAFIKSWDEKEESGYCDGEKEFKYAQEASKWLGVELYHADFVKDYWNRVFLKFLDDYKMGITPNPDVFCNREIKFDAFIDFGKDLGIDYIATGHYANLKYNNNNNNNPSLYRGKDYNKDQSYFLCMIKSEKLRNSLFPMGSFLKENVVKYAYSLGLDDIASKKSSRGICFIGKRSLPEFLSSYIDITPGKYIDISDTFVITQQHNGAITYTIGQKAMIHSVHEKYYVVGIDPKENIVYVCPEGKVSDYLYCSKIEIKNFNWLEEIPLELLDSNGGGFNARCQVRHRGEVVPCTIHSIPTSNNLNSSSIDDGLQYTVTFQQPIKSSSPGQILCLFDSVTDKCFGGGIINTVETFKNYKNQLNV